MRSLVFVVISFFNCFLKASKSKLSDMAAVLSTGCEVLIGKVLTSRPSRVRVQIGDEESISAKQRVRNMHDVYA